MGKITVDGQDFFEPIAEYSEMFSSLKEFAEDSVSVDLKMQRCAGLQEFAEKLEVLSQLKDMLKAVLDDSDGFRSLSGVAAMNPAIAFTRSAKAGDFDNLHPDAFEDCLMVVDFAARFWKDYRSHRLTNKTVNDFLVTCMHMLNLVEGMSLVLQKALLSEVVTESVDKYVREHFDSEFADVLNNIPPEMDSETDVDSSEMIY